MFKVEAFGMEFVDGVQALTLPRGAAIFDVGIVPGRGVVLFGKVDTERQLEDRNYILLAPDASLPDELAADCKPFKSVFVPFTANAPNGSWYHVFEVA